GEGCQAYSTDVYQHYRTWCEQNGHMPVAQRTLSMEVPRTFPGVTKKKARVGCVTPNAFVGLKRLDDPRWCPGVPAAPPAHPPAGTAPPPARPPRGPPRRPPPHPPRRPSCEGVVFQMFQVCSRSEAGSGTLNSLLFSRLFVSCSRCSR